MHYTAKFGNNPPPRSPARSTTGLADDDSVPELSGARPTPLVEPRPQERVLRHTVEHIVDFSPFVQILVVPVPLVVDLTGGADR